MNEEQKKALRDIIEFTAEATERLSKLFPLCTTDAEEQRYRNVKQLLNQISFTAKKGLGEK